MQQTALAEFHGTPISIIDHENKRWITAEDVGRCLGYAEATARTGITNLYNRHADEFTLEDTCAIKLMAQGQTRETRIFSETGCNLLSFFSNTPRAKEVRAWAKQVLAGQTPAPSPRRGIRLGRQPVTRRLERQVFELFVAGQSQREVAEELHTSIPVVNLMLRAKYQFAAGAGEPECSPELIKAVAKRLLTNAQARLAIEQQRLAQQFRSSANNAPLADALDRIGRHLSQAPDVALLPLRQEGGEE